MRSGSGSEPAAARMRRRISGAIKVRVLATSNELCGVVAIACRFFPSGTEEVAEILGATEVDTCLDNITL